MLAPPDMHRALFGCAIKTKTLVTLDEKSKLQAPATSTLVVFPGYSAKKYLSRIHFDVTDTFVAKKRLLSTDSVRIDRIVELY